jgi:hypothetical protein
MSLVSIQTVSSDFSSKSLGSPFVTDTHADSRIDQSPQQWLKKTDDFTDPIASATVNPVMVMFVLKSSTSIDSVNFL